MLMSGVSTALMVIIGTLAAPLAQRAPTLEEQKAFSEGLRLYEAGDACGAERAWRAGYAAAHDPAFLVRIGEAEEKADAPAEAVRSYQQYLRESPDATDRAEVEGRIRRLAPRSPSKPPAVAEAGDETEPGQGQAATPRAAADPVPPSAASRPTAAPRTVGGPQATDREIDDLTPLVDEDEVPGSRLNRAAWVSAGVAALFLGVAAFFGASAADKSGDANRLLTYTDPNTQIPREFADVAGEYDDHVRVGQRDDRIAKGFAICAGVSALVAAVLFVLDGTTESGPSLVQARASLPEQRPMTKPHHPAAPASGLGISWSF
jgi:hypothetical protein